MKYSTCIMNKITSFGNQNLAGASTENTSNDD